MFLLSLLICVFLWYFCKDITTQSGTSEGFYNEDGTLQKEKVSIPIYFTTRWFHNSSIRRKCLNNFLILFQILALSRTYATAIAGSPVSSSFGSQTNTYSLIFKSNEIFTPPLFLPVYFRFLIFLYNIVIFSLFPLCLFSFG